MQTIDRRYFLKGMGISLFLPLLDVMQAAQEETNGPANNQRRMVLIDQGFGFHAPNLFPKNGGINYDTTPYLDVLKDLRDHFTLISGTSHPDVDGGHLACVSFLTAAPKPTSVSFKNTISVDQVAAEQIGSATRFASLALAVGSGRGICFSRGGVEIPPESRPSRIFSRLFLEGSPADKERQTQKIKDGQSVMDSVLGEAKSLQRRLGARDRDKLDQYFTAVRSAEAKLVKAEEWARKPKPQVNVKPPRDIPNLADVIGRTRLMYDMIHLVLQTDSTRLITLHSPGVNAVPPLEGITQDYHNLSHHGQDPARLSELKVIETAQLKLFAEFLSKLQSTEEKDKTLLDQTIVMLGSELGNANSHDNRNLPVILAGGGFRHGQYLAFDSHKNTPLANLYVSMLQQLGLEVDKFASSTGPLSGLDRA
ncbi:DUF1552 domain-containing protein [Schlesneria sp. T3-172]|uniref:DUF1552 domain-containing protein n=1 Tax=Schlesneria sphaerica TaxID=3373610 RepID=UPI0037CB0AD2